MFPHYPRGSSFWEARKFQRYKAWFSFVKKNPTRYRYSRYKVRLLTVAQCYENFFPPGHPEFLPDIVNKIIDAREKMGAMNADTVKDGRERAVRRDDGIGIIGVAIWNVLGVKAP